MNSVKKKLAAEINRRRNDKDIPIVTSPLESRGLDLYSANENMRLNRPSVANSVSGIARSWSN